MKEELLLDRLETMILMAMDGNLNKKSSENISFKSSSSGMEYASTPLEMLVKISSQSPESGYTFNMCQANGSRLFTMAEYELLRHPSEIMGDKLEAMIMLEDHFKWLCYVKIDKPKKLIPSVFGRKVSSVYEAHFRKVYLSGLSSYARGFVLFDQTGKSVPYKINGNFFGNEKSDHRSAILVCSMVEDAYRANTMLCSIKDAVEIKFPVPLDSYKELFSIRDAPMNASGTRRKSIIHWVAKHLRHTRKGNQSTVKEHTRGVQEINIDGIRIRLEPNVRY